MTLLMGILNITTDSFSDGGSYLDIDRALSHARDMISAGAEIIDVGGESTRPGATRVPADQEQKRVVPIIRELHAEGIRTSVDTMRASTAAAAIEAGVTYINDVSGGSADPGMLSLCAGTGIPIMLMHWRTEVFASAEGESHGSGQIITDLIHDLSFLKDRALEAGIPEEDIILDPGIGFAKSVQDNWQILQDLCSPEGRICAALETPFLVGASRKRFLTALTGSRTGRKQGQYQQEVVKKQEVAQSGDGHRATQAEPQQEVVIPGSPESADGVTAALSSLLAAQGIWSVRVHNVKANREAIDLAQAIRNGKGPEIPEGWRAQRG